MRTRSALLPTRTILAASLVTALTSCVGHRHTVGLGSTGSEVTSERQYYILFGLVRFNEVDSQRLAADLTSYTIETQFSFTDLLLAPFLIPLTATSRTVVVRT